MSRRARRLLVGVAAAAVCVALGAAWLRHQARTACARLASSARLERLAADPARLPELRRALERRVQCRPWSRSDAYDLACAEARSGRTAEALAALELATRRGWDDAEWMLKDPDLASIRDQPDFERAVARARSNDATGFGPVEPGSPLEGLRTLEGRPDGGLRYRLRVPQDASAQRPARLVVWLHPSGTLFSAVEAQLAPDLGRLGYAFLLPTQKDAEAWARRDAEKLLGPTLQEVRAHDGVSAAPPVLLGFSAGGQMALDLWRERPESFGALILDAAYAARLHPDGAGWELDPLADGGAYGAVPVLAVVGGEDPLAAVWRRLAVEWPDAGIPLTVREVPGVGHDWLIGGAEQEALLQWIQTAAPPAARAP